MDWAVGWMDFREGLEGVVEVDEGDTDAQASKEDGAEAAEGRTARKKRWEEMRYAQTTPLGSSADVKLPPLAGDEEAGLLGDTRWLFGVMGKIIA